MNIKDNAKKFLGIAMVLSVLSIWGVAQTNQTATQKAGTGIDETQSKSVTSLTNSQLLSSAGTIIATNNGVTITQGPGASIPEGPEPQGGWFTPFYTAEGVVRYEVLDEKMEVDMSFDYPFSVSVGANNCWQIRQALPESFMTNLVAYDGTNVYSVSTADRYRDREGVVHMMEKPQTGTPIISPGKFPLGKVSGVYFLWLAYAGGDYLIQEKQERIPCDFYNALTHPSAWCSDFKYKLFSGKINNIVSEGAFVFNKKYVSERTEDYPYIDEPVGELNINYFNEKIKTLNNIKNENFIFSTYSLINKKSLNDLEIPTVFSSEKFSIPATSSESSHCSERIKGNVTNIIYSPGPVPLIPVFSGSVIMRDMRFATKTATGFRNSIWYNTTNEWILSTNDPIQKIAGSDKLSPKPTKPYKRSLYFYSLFTIILLSVIVFPIYYFLKK